MYNHTLSIVSKDVYNTLHPDLQKIIDVALKKCAVDFSLYEGYRSVEKQLEYYKKGRTIDHSTGHYIVVNEKAVITNIDGYNKKGKHNYNPSLAVDLRASIPDKESLTWDSVHLTYIAASFIMIAEFLYEQKEITHKLKWGGNWDMDGDLADNKLYDRPHLELYLP